MKVKFIAEKGNHGLDNVLVMVKGIKDLPKHLLVLAEDFITPIASGRAEVVNDELVVEADLREEDLKLYPAIGFESISEENINGGIVVKEASLQTIILQSTPNLDPEIKTIQEQIEEGTGHFI